jgi:hypothetical protein
MGAVVGIAVLLLVSGCNDSGRAPAGSAGGTHSEPATSALPDISPAAGGGGDIISCPPVSLVGSVLGATAGEGVRDSGPGGFICSYQVGSRPNVAIGFFSGATKASFAAYHANFDQVAKATVDIPGFFDQAFSLSDNDPNAPLNSVVARKGSTMVGVTSTAPFDREKILVEKLLAH